MSARTVLLWRHGRTEYNAAGRLQGQVDIPLDDIGSWQAQEAAGDIARRHTAARIASSDLDRAAATAQALADLVGVEVQLDERLRERAFGEWEGLTSEEISARWPDEHRVWQDGGDPVREGAESRREVAERMAAGIADHAGRTPDDGTLVVVSHGASITLALTTLLGLDAQTWRGVVGLHNAHWATLQANRAGASPAWRLETLNLGPSGHIDEWQAGVPAESLPSSAADAMRT